jgi:hypothetical protein
MTTYPVDSIVFDLDKTLIYTASSSVGELYRSGIMEDPKFFPMQSRVYYFNLPATYREKKRPLDPDGVSGMWGTMRPYAREFLEFCFKRFKRVIVFTAGTADYAIPICDVLFRGIAKPYMIWARGHCIRIKERASVVDQRLVDLGYYPSLSVPPDSEEMEHMNAKSLEHMAKIVSELEDDPTITKDQFMIVEDNYHSFITHDYHNAFLIPAYESSVKSDPTAKPGSPGYSPARQKLLQNQVELEDDETLYPEEDEDDGTHITSLLNHPININPGPIPIRKNTLYNWLLYDDETLKKLQTFIDINPTFTAKEYTETWNSMN